MQLAYETDKGAASSARLGLIVLQADETIEMEFKRLINLNGVVVYCTRVPSGVEVTERTLAAMEVQIPVAASLLPRAAEFDVIGYACTSGATIIGSDRVAHIIHEARPATDSGNFVQTRVTDPLRAVMAACKALKVQRLGFVTPYVKDVSAAMRTTLETSGLIISAFGSFEQSEESVVARISPTSVYEAVLKVGRAALCDAVFVSCTNVRTLDILEDAERVLGLPVITSNQALAWHMLRQAGIVRHIENVGRLLKI
ncbi:MAG: Asp/Glu racemase [Candidimonas sp.]|nr:MAG: Asp/Glu racemase [Candidimonas sp.]TAM25390.1 MAG: Asp/Glu racemase [Candidimonas sp.]